MFATIYADEQYARADVAFHIDLVRAFAPDVVVDSFGLPTCLAARALRIPLVRSCRAISTRPVMVCFGGKVNARLTCRAPRRSSGESHTIMALRLSIAASTSWPATCR